MEKKTKIILWVVIGIFVVIAVMGSALGGLYLVSRKFTVKRHSAYDLQAKSTLRNAVTVAEMYAAEHDGDYSGMNASELTKLEPKVKFTDGMPDNNVVSVDASADSYGLIVTSKSGKVFKAKKEPGKGVELDLGENK